jgi:predicted lipoprotein with Yx(FWY)xxD motif
MRKGRCTAAAGLGSLALLLTACGSSSSPTAASTSAPASSATSSSSTSESSSPASSPATAPSSGNATTSAPAQSPGPQASGGLGAGIPKGTTVLIVQHSKLGYVLAEANGQVVYTYSHDSKGGTPTCTGSCASLWLPVTGMPMAANGEHIPGTFSTVTRSDGTKQVTYNGYPLYTYSGAAPLSTHAIPGEWNVVPLSAADLG